MRAARCNTPPAIILGGLTNALSIARSLGRAGIRVYAVNEDTAPVRFSRYCRWLDVPWRHSDKESWTRFLIGPQSNFLRGAVLLAASDLGIEIIAQNRPRLEEKFLLDISDPTAQLCLLNKLSTYRAAVAAGVPTPKFWVTAGRDDLLKIRDELVFPLVVKPRLGHTAWGRLGKKLVQVQDFDQLLAVHEMVQDAGIETVLMETIPGPDDRLCSYYTYLDEAGRPLLHFTKRIIRRCPVFRGEACYHITDWIPEVRDLGLKLFRHVGLRGLGNVEFKRDERDGRLKLIECNARFTAANCLVADSGIDLAQLVYNRLTGRPYQVPRRYRTGLRLWYPVRDFKAFLELRRTKQLTWRGWLASVLHPQTLPLFRWEDPGPSLANCLQALKLDALLRGIREILAAPLRRLRGWLRRKKVNSSAEMDRISVSSPLAPRQKVMCQPASPGR